jgi:hypothetical protein
MTVATVNVPHDPTDAELLEWWRDSANRMGGTLSSVFAVASAVLFAVVMNRVRRLPGAAGAPAWLAFARSMGAAFTATLLVTAALRGVIAHLVDRLDQPLPSLDVLRYSTALNYLMMSLPVMTCLALTVFAVAVVTLRTSALPRWTAYVGVATAVVILGAVATGVGAYAIPAALLWSVCLGIALWRADLAA